MAEKLDPRWEARLGSQVLRNEFPSHIDPELDARLREEFKILLTREDMLPGNGRW